MGLQDVGVGGGQNLLMIPDPFFVLWLKEEVKKRCDLVRKHLDEISSCLGFP